MPVVWSLEAALAALFLGALQGLTEFAPVSSTAHLLLAEWALGLSPAAFGLPFDAALHLGTLAGIVAFFWRELKEMLWGLLRSVGRRRLREDPWAKEAWFLVIATLPAVGAGLLLEEEVETTFRSPLLVAGSLAAFGAVLLLAERWGPQKRDLEALAWADAILLGLAQAVALVPGVSRSGIVISAGMFLGLRREAAARFAFLLSAPVVAGAGGKQLLDIGRGSVEGQYLVLAAGLLASAIVGYLVIKYLLRFLAGHGLYAFAYYRFALAAAVVALFLSRG